MKAVRLNFQQEIRKNKKKKKRKKANKREIKGNNKESKHPWSLAKLPAPLAPRQGLKVAKRAIHESRGKQEIKNEASEAKYEEVQVSNNIVQTAQSQHSSN